MGSRGDVYDVVVVGAGLSGLSAAYHLKDFRVLTLEKESCIGGRVLTRHYNEIYYDLGAVFAYDPNLLPVDFKPPGMIRENGPVGIRYRDTLCYGASVSECIHKLRLNPEDLQQIEDYRNYRIEIDTLSKKNYDILNAFFKVIHPGEMNAYIPSRQRDAFERFHPHHYVNGNAGLAEAYQNRICSQIEINTEVVSVEEMDDSVQIVFHQGDHTGAVHSKTAVVTTPAPVTKRAVKSINSTCCAFLDSIKYGRFTVVALGVQDTGLEDFSYLITPDLPMDTVVNQKTIHDSARVLLVYYGDRASRPIRALSNDEIIRQALVHIRQLDIGTIEERNLLFSDVHRWDAGGTVIFSENPRDGDEASLRPSDRIFLAGDYLSRPLPYGMGAAIQSGKEAAMRVVRFFLDTLFRSRQTL